MTDAPTGMAKHSGITVEELRSVKFAKAFGRGYEQHEVDTFVDRCAAWIGWFTEQLRSAEQEIADLQEKFANDVRGEEVQQAISILTGAQKTADITVKQADVYSTRVMAEARDAFEEARLRTANLEQETDVRVKALWEDASVRSETVEREAASRAKALLEDASSRSENMQQEAAAKAKALVDEATASASALELETQAKVKAVVEEAQQRAAALDAETTAKLAEFATSSAQEQKELDAQTAYLRTLRDASRVQMQKFLEGLLDHIAEEYGRAHPVAAEAAAEPKRQPIEVAPGPRKAVGGRRNFVRRQYRVAGQPMVQPSGQGRGVPEPRYSDENSASVNGAAGNGAAHPADEGYAAPEG